MCRTVVVLSLTTQRVERKVERNAEQIKISLHSEQEEGGSNAFCDLFLFFSCLFCSRVEIVDPFSKVLVLYISVFQPFLCHGTLQTRNKSHGTPTCYKTRHFFRRKKNTVACHSSLYIYCSRTNSLSVKSGPV